jgi:Gas vesicle protein
MASSEPRLSNALPQTYGRADLRPREGGPANLADILERVLDKGIVIAGDIQINLLEIELLTIKLRLLVCSVDRAQEMGINWWESDPQLSSDAKELESENRDLRERLERVERMLEKGGAPRVGKDVEPRLGDDIKPSLEKEDEPSLEGGGNGQR